MWYSNLDLLGYLFTLIWEKKIIIMYSIDVVTAVAKGQAYSQ